MRARPIEKPWICSVDAVFLREKALLAQRYRRSTEARPKVQFRCPIREPLVLWKGRSTRYRKLKALTGQSINEFTRAIRLKSAAPLLETGQFSVADAALQTLFSEVKYFRNYFKAQFGCLPSEYTRTTRNRQRLNRNFNNWATSVQQFGETWFRSPGRCTHVDIKKVCQNSGVLVPWRAQFQFLFFLSHPISLRVRGWHTETRRTYNTINGRSMLLNSESISTRQWHRIIIFAAITCQSSVRLYRYRNICCL